jgi:hypothetical protein
MKKVRDLMTEYFCALAGCIYLFTLGIFSAQHRRLIRLIGLHFDFDKPPVDIPKIDVEQIIKLGEVADVIMSEQADGSVSFEELKMISRLVKQKNPSVIFEFGTFEGRTTLNAASHSSAAAKVYTLALPRSLIESTKFELIPHEKRYCSSEFMLGRDFKDSPYSGKICQLLGDSACFDFSPYLSACDMVFIDGSHAYEYVVNDTQIALKLLRNGKGLILWHCYGTVWKGVTRALEEMYVHGGVFADLKHLEGTSLVYLELK